MYETVLWRFESCHFFVKKTQCFQHKLESGGNFSLPDFNLYGQH